MLAAILGPAHGMAATLRQPGKADFFRQQDSLVPEAAADVGGDDTDSALLHAEALGKAAARDVRHLGRGIERELVETMIEGRDHAAPLER